MINTLLYRLQLIVIVGCILFSLPLHAQPLQPLYQWTVDDDAFVIVNVKLNGSSVISDMEAYYTKDNRLLMPIHSVSTTLGITLTIKNNILIGQLEHSDNPFSAVLHNNAGAQNAWLWAKDDFDHYIDLEILNSVLKTQSKFNYSLMQLSFTSSLLKAKNNNATSTPVSYRNKAIQFDHSIPDLYQTISYPITEYALNTSYSSRTKRSKGLVRLNSYFDLLEHQAELRFNQNKNQTSTFFKVKKHIDLFNSDERLINTHYQVGDIQSSRDPLVMSATQGRGVTFSNTNPNTSQSFSTITIEEPTLPGWIAELYRNGQYIASSVSQNENVVRFEDIETFYGNNVFEIRLFGPQGEQLTKKQKVTVGENALAPGKFSYKLEAIDAQKSLFGNKQSNTTPFEHALNANLSYGLTDKLTFDSSISALNAEHPNRYISAGINGISDSGSYKVIAAKQLSAGHALFTGYRGIITGLTDHDININAQASLIDNFTSAIFSKQKHLLKRRMSVSLNGKSSWISDLNWDFRWLNEHRNNKSERNITSFGVNKNYLGGTWSSQFQYDDSQDMLTNRAYWSLDLKGWRWTNSVDWLPVNDRKLKSFRSNLRWPQTQDSFNQTQISYNPNANAKLLLGHQYTYRHHDFNVNFSGQYDSEDDWQISIGLSGTFSFDHVENTFEFDSPRTLSSGQLEVLSFVDWNNNQVFDSDDQPVSDAILTGNYRWKDLKTNDNGRILLPSSSGGQILEVDVRSLSNPYYQSSYGKIKTLSHRGGISRVNIPISVFNEVEGTLYFANSNASKPAAGVSVMLLDVNGDIQYETISEYDGYYFFSNVSAGKYTVKIESNQLNIANLIVKNLPNEIITPKTGDTLILKDIILLEQHEQLEHSHILTNQDISENSYFVQLGVFKKFSSALIVAKNVPNNLNKLHIYHNQLNMNYYLISGSYASKALAQQAINSVYAVPSLFGSFMVDARRYDAKTWHNLGTINQDSNHRYFFCEYARYRSAKQLNRALINSIDTLFILKLNRNAKANFQVLSGPHDSNKGKQCDPHTSQLIKSPLKVKKLSWHSVISGLRDAREKVTAED
ncbi:carboxypeptidase-like regulatory domain-containing protein [Pseudoalteromonas aurantia]|uniref:SPOR domain-containing protein n=1 Tax=Pseudoalteromonas aurantia 208 TaxID=1314867 RepID=A0ABR9ECH0_9GAMM|nr:carboxypeptidase-like regulatory domain-containing protein [Pseudoalteromonas aurantia]MBE0368044.1 hypothetical protein [Pseudoalteromonas aurantia 208]